MKCKFGASSCGLQIFFYSFFGWKKNNNRIGEFIGQKKATWNAKMWLQTKPIQISNFQRNVTRLYAK